MEAGAGVKEIQERLGHSDINTTMNIYAHMTKNIEEKRPPISSVNLRKVSSSNWLK
ncbi:tyrosine-type recombinase/integrase [Peribacillus sp. NPDC097895]|uniref:tyrosine-type recombinase/integrase n=1 Tax=Peribacillus sp. NPDC097895 TaxID=3390619 RepID=UPI003CFC4D77